MAEIFSPTTKINESEAWSHDLLRKLRIERMSDCVTNLFDENDTMGMQFAVLIQGGFLSWKIDQVDYPATIQFDLLTNRTIDVQVVFDSMFKFFSLGSHTLRLFDRSGGDMERIIK